MCLLLFRSVRSSLQANHTDAYDKALIIGRLDTLKALQVAYKAVNGDYANDFKTLAAFAQNAQLMGLLSNGQTTIDTSMSPLFNSQNSAIQHLGYVDKAQTIPFVFEASYTIQSGDTLPYFEISTPVSLGNDRILRIGNKTLNTLDGNWR
jgi:hypothetical protein